MIYPDDYINKVICGNCLEVMRQMPDKCVDLVVTDPPYGIEYHSNYYSRGNPHSEIINDDKLFLPLEELWRITKDGGAIYVFYSFKEPLIDSRVKNQIVWVKDNWSAGDLEGDYGNQYETIAFIPKPGFKLKGKRYSNVWNFPREKPEFHPTQKPIQLMSRIILESNKDGIILDPFLGSGTTAVAAKYLHRRFIGIEISEKYCQIARERLRQEILI